MNKTDTEFLIAGLELKTELSSTELADFEACVQTKGFKLFLGLLLGSKQAHLVALANTPLGTAEKSCQASVLQGTVKGIDLVFQTVVESFTPAEKEEPNGDRT